MGLITRGEHHLRNAGKRAAAIAATNRVQEALANHSVIREREIKLERENSETETVPGKPVSEENVENNHESSDH